VQVFYIPSSSMVPTLAVDDRIVVEKVSYRFGGPVRGDVVVFAGADRVADVDDDRTLTERALQAVGRFVGVVPPDPSDLVKRVIGLPGEEVSIVGGLLHIDGVALTEAYVADAVAADFGPVVVPDGSLFFLGDNRRNSADSRGGLGFVDEERVIGRAVAVVWPFGNAASLVGERPRPVPQTSSVG
jgi:signal peptidase I